ncbi:MAG: zinc ribbon domain-containing protein [Gammaproteobacteria bacterium]|nr:zinc ribbon domain-containing protein [Gammaproteobacteria bacterium]
MFCRYCGKKLKSEAVICTACRRPVEPLVGGSDAADGGTAWSFGTMLALILAALTPLSPIGIGIGLFALRNPGTKIQGAVLMTVSIFMSLLWLAMMLGL